MSDEFADARRAASEVARSLDADVLFFSGTITRDAWLSVARLVQSRNRRRRNVLLVLVTPGGDPDAAFRIGRCLQQSYNGNVLTFIPGWCKSAGTLVTLASRQIFIGDYGELGPLDIQLAKPDELFEMSSGLSIHSALQTLETTASKMFVNLLVSIRADTGGSITTRTAAELAADIIGSLLEPIYRQVEPMKIGENQRAMSITKNYGMRLAQRSGSIRDRKSLDLLILGYPDHGFVIDREEASKLLFNVEKPKAQMERLAEAMGDRALHPKEGRGAVDVIFLSEEPAPLKVSRAARTVKEDQNGSDRAEKSTRRPRRPSPGEPAGAPGRRAKRPTDGRARNGLAADAAARPAAGNGTKGPVASDRRG